MKTKFELDVLNEPKSFAKAMIIGTRPNYIPYVKINYTDDRDGTEHGLCLQDADMETFAVNILKALKSKKLKSTAHE